MMVWLNHPSEFGAQRSNYIMLFCVDLILYSCPKLGDGLVILKAPRWRHDYETMWTFFP